MKALLIFSILLSSIFASAQTDTTSLSGSDSKFYSGNDERSWLITLDQDTVTNLDTIFADGDTITAVFDSLIVELPNTFADGYHAQALFSGLQIGDSTNVDLTILFQESAGSGSPWSTIPNSTSVIAEDTAMVMKNFYIRNLRMRYIVYINTASSQVGFNGWVFLKPSSIPSVTSE